MRMPTKGQGGRRIESAVAALVLASPAACHVFAGYRRCDDVPAPRMARLPERLSRTGLFAARSTAALAPGVVPYHPRFELWSDGAAKRRWIFLPSGARIDSADMDAWRFPEGTKLWKEFTRDGVRVETRLLQKVGPAPQDWAAVAYVWSEDGSDGLADARAMPDGLVDARGTAHDVPPARHCMACHGGTESRVLGFSAVQLAPSATADEMDLDRLVREGRLTAAPAAAPRVPGDATVQAALGYLHANCGHCHNQHRPAPAGARCFDPRRDFDLSLRVGELSTPEATAAYRTAIGNIVFAGAPAASPLLDRVHGGGFFVSRMPPLATEIIDPRAGPLLEAWIRGLEPPKERP